MTRREELFALARATKGFMPDDEGVALFEAARSACEPAAAPSIVEVGAWCGKSTVYLGAAAEEVGAVVLSVDHHHGSEELQEGWADYDSDLVDAADGRVNTLGAWQRTIADAALEASVVGLVGDSVTVARHVRQGITFCFIDGGHGHDVAWADYHAWVPLLCVGGVLAIHDVFEDPRDGGRPPYELYCHALSSGFSELSCVGSLRVLCSARGAGH